MSTREPGVDSSVHQPSARLLASEARLRAVIDGALDCIISIDAGGRIVEFNPAAERTFAYRREDVIGRSLSETIVPPALRAAHEAGLKRYLATGVARVAGQRRVPAKAV